MGHPTCRSRSPTGREADGYKLSYHRYTVVIFEHGGYWWGLPRHHHAAILLKPPTQRTHHPPVVPNLRDIPQNLVCAIHVATFVAYSFAFCQCIPYYDTIPSVDEAVAVYIHVCMPAVGLPNLCGILIIVASPPNPTRTETEWRTDYRYLTGIDNFLTRLKHVIDEESFPTMKISFPCICRAKHTIIAPSVCVPVSCIKCTNRLFTPFALEKGPHLF